MAKKHQREAALKACENGKHKQRESGDDTGENERKKNEPAEERFAWEACAVESKRSEKTQRERKSDGARCDEETVEHGIPNGTVGEELAIPIERELPRWKSADAVAIEGI
jgi:hypothetical protein